MKKLITTLFFAVTIFGSIVNAQTNKWGYGTEFAGIEPNGNSFRGTVPLLLYASYTTKISKYFNFVFRPGVIVTSVEPQIDLLFKHTFENSNYIIGGAKAHILVNDYAQSPPKLSNDLTYALGVGIAITQTISFTITHYGGSYAWFGLDFKL